MRRVCLLFTACVLACSSCITREVSQLDPEQVLEQKTEIPVDLNRDMDILFVIDNSGSMETEHISLREEFPRIIDALDFDGVGLPSLHIGVITTDLGAGGACSGSGDNGNLRGADAGCAIDGAFIQDLANEDGSRTRNYSGTMSDAFSCIADVGSDGCGFEQPLEAIRRALDGNSHNDGFLRDHAYLAVIVVTDEDDCSTFDEAMFDPTPVDLSHPLGPPTSFRCFEFGVECEGGANLRQAGSKENCVPRSGSPYLHDIEPYTQFLRSLKPFPQQVLLTTISGSLEGVEVEHVEDERFSFPVARLMFSCETENGEAVPPIRLQTALENTGVPVKQASICDGILTDAVSELAEFFVDQVAPCVRGDLMDIDPGTPELEPECTVTEISLDSEGDRHERVLPECDDLADPASSSRLPCYTMRPADQCSDTPTGLGLEIHYAEGTTVPPFTRAVAACRGA